MGVSANNQSSSNKYIGSEDNGGSSDGQCSSPVQSSDDDTVSDEDFRVDEAEMHTVCTKKINERFLDEGIQSRAGIDEEIQSSSDEFDDDYLQFLNCHHGSSSSIQGGNAEIFNSSVNGVNNGSFIQPSPLPCRLNAKSGATKRRGRPPKNTIVVIDSESEADKNSIGEFGNRKKGKLSDFEGFSDGDELYLEWLGSHGLSVGCGNGGNRKRGRPLKGMNVGADSETGNELKPMNGYRKRGRTRKKTIFETDSESQNELFGEIGKFENGGSRERGMLSQFEDVEDGDELYMQWLRNLELSSRRENGGNQQRGRLPKNGGCGKRGKRPQFEDVADGDEMYLRVSRNLKLSGRSENVGVGSEPKNDGHQQRGTLPKNLNKGFDFQRGCRRSRRLQAMSRK